MEREDPRSTDMTGIAPSREDLGSEPQSAEEMLGLQRAIFCLLFFIKSVCFNRHIIKTE